MGYISTISHNRTPIDYFQFQFDKKRRFRFFQTFPPKGFRWGRAFQFFLKKLAGIQEMHQEKRRDRICGQIYKQFLKEI